MLQAAAGSRLAPKPKLAEVRLAPKTVARAVAESRLAPKTRVQAVLAESPLAPQTMAPAEVAEVRLEIGSASRREGV